ncbi:putative bacteriophage protein [Ralstonia solanacearum CFBP2957]|nr:putative bacteriophage protein [Ralstonia solanacearum CFBP2957]
MSVGLEIYNAAGVRTFSTNDRVGRVLGTTYTGTADGSISHGELVNGQGFCTCLPLGSIPGPGDYWVAFPSVVLDGSTIRWTFPTWSSNPTARRVNCLLVFGVW